MSKKTRKDRILQFVKVNPKNGCWEWTGLLDRDGYGVVVLEGKRWKAHRASYEEYKGKIAEGMVLDHLCRNRCCVNPSHLQPVTVRENTLRGEGIAAQKAKQTHCIRGHDLSIPENVGRSAKNNTRYCKICKRERRKSKNEFLRTPETTSGETSASIDS